MGLTTGFLGESGQLTDLRSQMQMDDQTPLAPSADYLNRSVSLSFTISSL